MRLKKYLTSILVIYFMFNFCINAFADINDGLVAYYPYNGNADDESGNGNDGTVNGASLTTDRFGNVNSAYSFDGVDDYIDIPFSPSIEPSIFSLSAWIKTSGFRGYIISSDPDNYYCHHGYQLWVTNEGYARLTIDPTSGCRDGYYTRSNSLVNDDIWHYIVATYDDTSLKLYVDGILESETPSQGYSKTGASVRIGMTRSTEPAWRYFFDGFIDGVRIYNRALSEEEIQELYEDTTTTTTTIPPITEGLVGYWKFDGDATDSSGNGNDGDEYGDPDYVDNGDCGQAISFDGVDDYIDIGGNVKPPFPITVSAWVKINSFDDWGVIFGNDRWHGYLSYYGVLFYYTIDGEVGCAYGDGGVAAPYSRKNKVTNDSVLSINTWHHIVARFNACNNMDIYVDGIEREGYYLGSGDCIAYSTTYDGAIGANTNSYWANGIIDDIRIYDRALSQEEIQEIVNECNPGSSHTTTIPITTTIPVTTTTIPITTTIPVTTTTIPSEDITVDFMGSPTFGFAPLTVNFTNLTSGNISGYEWSFGDGSTSGAENPSHTYTKMGNFGVILTAYGTDGSLETEIKSNYVFVLPGCPFASALENQKDVDTLRTLRDSMLNNVFGLIATCIYYQNADEIASILTENPELQDELRDLVSDNISVAVGLINVGNASVLKNNVADVIEFLNDLKQEGSFKLNADINLVIGAIRIGYFLYGIGINVE